MSSTTASSMFFDLARIVSMPFAQRYSVLATKSFKKIGSSSLNSQSYLKKNNQLNYRNYRIEKKNMKKANIHLYLLFQ
jgi:hypothetical protein